MNCILLHCILLLMLSIVCRSYIYPRVKASKGLKCATTRLRETLILNRATAKATTTTTALPPALSLTKPEEELFDAINLFVKEKRLETTVRVAGGWVRDKLLGIEGKYDVDLVLDNMSGQRFANLLSGWIGYKYSQDLEVGVIKQNPAKSKHLETATAKLGEFVMDFVELRTETYTDSSSRIPQRSVGTPLQDALRRDLTINSLFFNIHTRSLEDLTGLGLADLQHGLIRTPLDPLVTLHDDPLRALRAVRFTCCLTPQEEENTNNPNHPKSSRNTFNRPRLFNIVPELQLACSDSSVHAALRDKVSPERIRGELRLMTRSLPMGARAIALLDQFNLLHNCILRFPSQTQKIAPAAAASSRIGTCNITSSSSSSSSSSNELVVSKGVCNVLLAQYMQRKRKAAAGGEGEREREGKGGGGALLDRELEKLGAVSGIESSIWMAVTCALLTHPSRFHETLNENERTVEYNSKNKRTTSRTNSRDINNNLDTFSSSSSSSTSSSVSSKSAFSNNVLIFESHLSSWPPKPAKVPPSALTNHFMLHQQLKFSLKEYAVVEKTQYAASLMRDLFLQQMAVGATETTVTADGSLLLPPPPVPSSGFTAALRKQKLISDDHENDNNNENDTTTTTSTDSRSRRTQRDLMLALVLRQAGCEFAAAAVVAAADLARECIMHQLKKQQGQGQIQIDMTEKELSITLATLCGLPVTEVENIHKLENKHKRLDDRYDGDASSSCSSCSIIASVVERECSLVRDACEKVLQRALALEYLGGSQHDPVWLTRPMLNGARVKEEILLKGEGGSDLQNRHFEGQSFGHLMQLQLEWKLLHPSGTEEELIHYLRNLQ